MVGLIYKRRKEEVIFEYPSHLLKESLLDAFKRDQTG